MTFVATTAAAACPPDEYHAEMTEYEYKKKIKEDFNKKKKDMGSRCEELIEKLRNVLLQQNQNGEFLRLGISPAVFTDDFVVRASTFLEKTNHEECMVGYVYKETGPIKEGWLIATMVPIQHHGGAIEKRPESLFLLRFPKKSGGDYFFTKLLDSVTPVFEEFFSKVSKQTMIMVPKPQQAGTSGMELRAALAKAQELRARGIYKSKVEVLNPNTDRVEYVLSEAKPIAQQTSAPELTQAKPIDQQKEARELQRALMIKVLVVALILLILHSWFAKTGKFVKG